MARRILCILSAVAAFSLIHSQSARADTITYTYDALGRVVTVTHSNGATTNYVYDAAGNRTSRTSTAGTGGNGTVVVLPLLGGLVIPL